MDQTDGDLAGVIGARAQRLELPFTLPLRRPIRTGRRRSAEQQHARMLAVTFAPGMARGELTPLGTQGGIGLDLLEIAFHLLAVQRQLASGQPDLGAGPASLLAGELESQRAATPNRGLDFALRASHVGGFQPTAVDHTIDLGESHATRGPENEAAAGRVRPAGLDIQPCLVRHQRRAMHQGQRGHRRPFRAFAGHGDSCLGHRINRPASRVSGRAWVAASVLTGSVHTSSATEPAEAILGTPMLRPAGSVTTSRRSRSTSSRSRRSTRSTLPLPPPASAPAPSQLSS